MEYCRNCDIVYDESRCPLCEAENTIRELTSEIDELNKKIEENEKEIDELK